MRMIDFFKTLVCMIAFSKEEESFLKIHMPESELYMNYTWTVQKTLVQSMYGSCIV